MKSPLTGKQMILKSEPTTLNYKGKAYTIDWQYYHCEVSNEQFTTTELDEENLQAIYDQYNEDIKNTSTIWIL
jgi:hypothetical protein